MEVPGIISNPAVPPELFTCISSATTNIWVCYQNFIINCVTQFNLQTEVDLIFEYLIRIQVTWHIK